MAAPSRRGFLRQLHAASVRPSARHQTCPATQAPFLNLVSKHMHACWPPALQAFQAELEATCEAAGLRLRRLDKKAERSLVFAQRKAWEAAATVAADPSALLALAVPLLLARQHGRLVSLPGRALGAGVEALRSGAGALPEEACQLLFDFHSAVVEQLKLQSGDGGAEEADELARQLEELTPRVRALAVGGGEAAGDA